MMDHIRHCNYTHHPSNSKEIWSFLWTDSLQLELTSLISRTTDTNLTEGGPVSCLLSAVVNTDNELAKLSELDCYLQ